MSNKYERRASNTSPSLLKARERKIANQARNKQALEVEARSLGIGVQELKTRKYKEVQLIRRGPSFTPSWEQPVLRYRY